MAPKAVKKFVGLMASPERQLPPLEGLTFSAGNHQYKLTGQKGTVPSVTTIIGCLNKPALIPWAAKLTANYIINLIPDIIAGKQKFNPEDAGAIFEIAKNQHKTVSGAALDIGSAVHDSIEVYVKTGVKPKKDDRAFGGFNAFLKWAKEYDFNNVLASEYILYCPLGHGIVYSGTMDLLVYLGNRLYLIDIKTSAGFYEPDMPMQLCAYKQGVEHHFPELKIDGVGIIRLDKETGLPEFRDYSDKIPAWTEMFNHIARFECLRRATVTKRY